MLFVASALEGYAIEASDGGIGTVTDVLFDDSSWKIRWLVVETGTWLTGHKVLIHPSAIERTDYEWRRLRVKLTKLQVKDSLDIRQDLPVSMQRESSLHDHYGWQPDWGADYFRSGAVVSALAARPYIGTLAPPDAPSAKFPPDSGERRYLQDGVDPHLRSIAAVTGYHIHATDGEIGHVETFVVDDIGWIIRYLTIDTRNWWPGQHVLISPHAVEKIAWEDRDIDLNVTREQVRTSPPWDLSKMIDQAYASGLHEHYHWPGYGW